MIHLYGAKKAQGILLFLSTIFAAIIVILDCFTADGFSYYLLPALVAVTTAVFAGILLFGGRTGDDYARYLMLCMVLVCAGLIVTSIATMIKNGSFSADILVIASLVLFAICLGREDSDETAWKVLNYIAFSFLTLIFAATTLIFLFGGGVLFANASGDPAFVIAGSVFVLTAIFSGCFLAFCILSLALTREHPIE
jgi:hypothetical protein